MQIGLNSHFRKFIYDYLNFEIHIADRTLQWPILVVVAKSTITRPADECLPTWTINKIMKSKWRRQLICFLDIVMDASVVLSS